MSVSLKHDRDTTANTNVMQDSRVITNVNSFAKRLIWARERRGWTQKELAREAGVSQSAIGNYEAGTRESSRQVLTLAKALRVDAGWLATGVGEPQGGASDVAPIGAPPPAWPFTAVTAAEWQELGEDDRLRLDGALALALAQIRRDPLPAPAPSLVVVQRPGDVLPAGAAANDDYVEVAQYDVRFAAGSGKLAFDANPRNRLAFRRSFLQAERVRERNAIVVYAMGDSMEPVIPDRAALLIDRASRELADGNNGRVFGFRLDGELLVKQLRKQADGTILAVSFNPKYDPIKLDGSRDFEIIGRVVWMGTRL